MAAETKGPERIVAGIARVMGRPVNLWGEHDPEAGEPIPQVTAYVRADLHDALRARYEEAMGALETIKNMQPTSLDRVALATQMRAVANALLQRHKEGV